MTTKSPVRWMGGKHHLAQKIIASFPPLTSYDIYVEPFGGAAHVLLAKPPYRHTEIHNDMNDNLVNFWLCMRDHLEEMQQRLETLPYARSLYYSYHRSLFDGTPLDAIERAVRWYYVLSSSFRAEVSVTPNGWNSSGLRCEARASKNAVQLFSEAMKRLRHVHFDNRDFEGVIKQYESLRTLIYCDPPYLDAEHYYQGSFNLEDHKRLATLLNNTPSKVALSYYPHPLLDELYPENRWRRIMWKTPKHSQRTKETHDIATEMLLCNYPAQSATLWNDATTLANEIAAWEVPGEQREESVG
jgi:DNA adenine methylase